MYIFNPENDLALANFSSNYTPPASIIKLGLDLSMLPFWFAPNNSIIISQSDIDNKFVEKIGVEFGIKSSVIGINNIPLNIDCDINPWGWSPYLVNKLISLGFTLNKLPSSEYLEVLRDYSSRKNAVRMLSELKNQYPQFYGESSFITDLDELLVHLLSTEGDKALKMPLSGSGRGLIWILNGITDKQTDWARRVIKTQGGIVAEPKLDKVQDFAMEFSIRNRISKFEGYSLFESAASGAYMGNVLMSDNDIEVELSKYISLEMLHGLRFTLLEKLPNYFPMYNGFLGVDMMVCNTDDGYKLQPCIEINMRMNMGLVSHIFYNRYVHSNSKGVFKVEYFKRLGDAFQFHQDMLTANPPIVEDGRIKSGYMSLTPVNKDTKYVVWVEIA